MVLDSKIQHVKDYFGITELSHWESVEPGWILRLHGVGKVTLDHIRMYLSARGITLKGDRTAEYWKEHLSDVAICHQMAEFDIARIAPFTVVIDTREQASFSFLNIAADSSASGSTAAAPIIVPTITATLRTGDYSIEHYTEPPAGVAIERKSLADLYATLTRERDRWERELVRLREFSVAEIVVEAAYAEVANPRDERMRRHRRSVCRSIDAWQQRFREIHWNFYPTRRLAEIKTFRKLERFWQDRNGKHAWARRIKPWEVRHHDSQDGDHQDDEPYQEPHQEPELVDTDPTDGMVGSPTDGGLAHA